MVRHSLTTKQTLEQHSLLFEVWSEIWLTTPHFKWLEVYSWCLGQRHRDKWGSERSRGWSHARRRLTKRGPVFAHQVDVVGEERDEWNAEHDGHKEEKKDVEALHSTSCASLKQTSTYSQSEWTTLTQGCGQSCLFILSCCLQFELICEAKAY